MTGATHFGISVELNDDLDAAALLFGEAQGRIVVSCAAASAPEVIEAAAGANVAAAVIGRVGEKDGRFEIRTRTGASIDLPVASLHEVYMTAIPRMMERPPRVDER
jgi:phosphoribosylformylglycinamidine synthase